MHADPALAGGAWICPRGTRAQTDGRYPGIFLFREKIPCSGKKISCSRQNRELRAMHWTCCTN
jgi:hypothetical protein